MVEIIEHILKEQNRHSQCGFGRLVDIKEEIYSRSVIVDWLDNKGHAHRNEISMSLLVQVTKQIQDRTIYNVRDLGVPCPPPRFDSFRMAQLAYEMNTNPMFVVGPMPEGDAGCIDKPKAKPKKELAMCSKHLWK